MHGDELKYVIEAYETNWMSTVGANINEVERIAAEKAEMKYAVGLSCCTAALHLAVMLPVNGASWLSPPQAWQVISSCFVTCVALLWGKRVFPLFPWYPLRSTV